MGTDMYGADGVRVPEGDSFSAFAGAICASTFSNSPFVEVKEFAKGRFRGPRGFRFGNLPPDYFLDAPADGTGTKPVIITAARAYRHAARDLLAMTAGDITRFGGKPLVLVNSLEVSSLGQCGDATNNAFREMMRGLEEVAHEQQIVCLRGETAELGPCVGSENPDAITKFIWSGFMIGAYLPDRIITGDSLGHDRQAIVALHEPGFRANGLSTARSGLRRRFGDTWWNNPDAQKIIEAVAHPSALYDRFLAEANGWTCPVSGPQFHFHLIAHITGGGIVGKFAEDLLFPRGLSAKLGNLFAPPEAMCQIAEWRGMPDEECYRVFGCGQGALVVLSPEQVGRFVEMAASYGIRAQWCGTMSPSDDPRLIIDSRFSNKQLVFRPHS